VAAACPWAADRVGLGGKMGVVASLAVLTVGDEVVAVTT
jgi:hypothetical protein